MFPPAVAVAEMRETGDLAALLPAEAAYLGRAVPSRAREFAAGRQCARRALQELGIDQFPVRVAADRQPIWPDSIVGSITHTRGFCAAVVAQRKRILGIGIDTEAVVQPRAGLAARICVPAELDWVDSLPAAQRTAATLMIFSAKEAFYKCQYPLVGEWLDFNDVSIEALAWRGDSQPEEPAGAAPGDFLVRAMRPIAARHRAPMPVRGHYRFHEQFVSAGVLWPAPG